MRKSTSIWLCIVLTLHGCASQSDGDVDDDCTCVKYYDCSATPIKHPGPGPAPGPGPTPGPFGHIPGPGPETGSAVTPGTGGGELPDYGGIWTTPVPGGGEETDDGSHGGEGLIDIRQTTCAHYLESCCPRDRLINPPGGDHIIPATAAPPPVDHGCGHRNFKGLNFQITGDKHGESQIGEFPWMVAIHVARTTGKDKSPYQCGGSLINLQVVLTAAHCVAGLNPRDLTVRAGEWDTQTTNEQYPHQDRVVQHFVTHERYYAAALHNDIALLFLESPVEPLHNIGTICLPVQGETFDHVRCLASGWGKDFYGKVGKAQVILKKLELPIVPRNQCEKSLRATRLGKLFKLHESAICAGGEAGIDTCSGDGGGPLVCPLSHDDQHYQQVGIVAWGIGCGERNTPGVYVNIAHFRTWIDDQMNANNIYADSYTRPGNI